MTNPKTKSEAGMEFGKASSAFRRLFNPVTGKGDRGAAVEALSNHLREVSKANPVLVRHLQRKVNATGLLNDKEKSLVKTALGSARGAGTYARTHEITSSAGKPGSGKQTLGAALGFLNAEYASDNPKDENYFMKKLTEDHIDALKQAHAEKVITKIHLVKRGAKRLDRLLGVKQYHKLFE